MAGTQVSVGVMVPLHEASRPMVESGVVKLEAAESQETLWGTTPLALHVFQLVAPWLL